MKVAVRDLSEIQGYLDPEETITVKLTTFFGQELYVIEGFDAPTINSMIEDGVAGLV